MFVCVLYQTPMNSLGSREILKYKYIQQSMLDIPLAGLCLSFVHTPAALVTCPSHAVPD